MAEKMAFWKVEKTAVSMVGDWVEKMDGTMDGKTAVLSDDSPVVTRVVSTVEKLATR